MKKFVLIPALISLVLLLFAAFFAFYEARFLVGRASVTVQSFSVENSYMFVTPLQAKADGQEKIRVTVFVLSDQGLGVAGRKVVLDLDTSLKAELEQGLTDSLGKATFDIVSDAPGEYYVQVEVDGKVLPQKAHLSFH